MKTKYNNINPDIIEKIDNLDVKNNEKNFIKDALALEYDNRDTNSPLKKFYEDIIDKYFDE